GRSGHLIFFGPRPLEVHRQAASWFWDREIFDFVGARLHWLEEISLRHLGAQASGLGLAPSDLSAWLVQKSTDWNHVCRLGASTRSTQDAPFASAGGRQKFAPSWPRLRRQRAVTD